MWTGTCEWIGDADCGGMIAWIRGISFSQWPQQHKIDHQLRPAMVQDTEWHGFRDQYRPIIDEFERVNQRSLPAGFRTTNPMLSVVMPGHEILPHRDVLADNWICRIHIPLTYSKAVFIIGGEEHRMLPGSAYRVNISRIHAVYNYGPTPRIHFMFDCYDAQGST